MKRILGELWTNRREAERLEVLSRNAEIDRENERKAIQRLQDYRPNPLRTSDLDLWSDQWMR